MQMPHRLTLLIALFPLALLALSGCASTPGAGDRKIPEELRSDFLRDYARLEPVGGDLLVWRWLNPEVDFGKYKRFMIETVDSVVPPAYRETQRPNPKIVAAATAYFREALARELGKRYEIVDRPGENVGRISIALTSIQPSARQLSNWQYLPIPLVVAGVSEMTGARERDVVAYMEGSITDSLNGELLMEMMKGRVGPAGRIRTIEDVTMEAIKPILDFWSNYLQLLEDAKRG
jgi:hypothetical protein